MRQPVIAQVLEAPSEMIVAFEHPGKRRYRRERSFVAQPRVDLVGIDPDFRVPPQDGGDGFEILVRQDAAGRILRRVEDDEPCLLRDLRFELGRIEGEIARLAQMQRHRHRAVCDDLRLVDRKPGFG